MDNFVNEVKNYWNSVSDSEWYNSLRTEDKIKQLVNSPEGAFHPAVFDMIQKHVGSLTGKVILCPSSGDNHAAIAFALMGAKVTSADISERQLENAKRIADSLNLTMEFVCDNTMELAKIEGNQYDLVYTSNGTLSWMTDLDGMYRNVCRVLKTGGLSLLYDMHPFNRPFSGQPWQAPEIVKSYQDVLPDLHWRVQDIVNANINAGMSIEEMAELPAVNASFWFSYDELVKQSPETLADINDWQKNPMAALPAWLVLIAKKGK